MKSFQDKSILCRRFVVLRVFHSYWIQSRHFKIRILRVSQYFQMSQHFEKVYYLQDLFLNDRREWASTQTQVWTPLSSVPGRLYIHQATERRVSTAESSGNRSVKFFDRSECHIFPSVAMTTVCVCVCVFHPTSTLQQVTNVNWKDETFNYLFVGYKKKLIQYVNKDFKPGTRSRRQSHVITHTNTHMES